MDMVHVHDIGTLWSGYIVEWVHCGQGTYMSWVHSAQGTFMNGYIMGTFRAY